MTHPLVTQLRFARSEFIRCVEGVTAEEATQRLQPMNSLSWIVGHLANQEHRLWVIRAQGKNIALNLNEHVGFGKPASTPPWEDMWALWRGITYSADKFLNTITPEMLEVYIEHNGKPMHESIGKSLLRNIYHYWFHIGEAHAIRQVLGHKDLPDFVGNMVLVQY
jgi:hypothetical protein